MSGLGPGVIFLDLLRVALSTHHNLSQLGIKDANG